MKQKNSRNKNYVASQNSDLLSPSELESLKKETRWALKRMRELLRQEKSKKKK